MRRSLRKIDTREVGNYQETEQLFTVMSLEEARQRLLTDGRNPASYCFFTWMREGIRYYRVWEDKKLKAGIVQGASFGTVAARLKRADAEKLYTVAKRFNPGATDLYFDIGDGRVAVCDRNKGPQAIVSVPQVGGELILERTDGGWNFKQAAHFLNVILVRGQSPDVAFHEASNLQ